MKVLALFLSALLFTINCFAQGNKKNSREKGVGIAHKTANPNTPYIYKNGYLNFNIEKIPVPEKNDTLNTLKFNAVYSALYTHKVMYDKFAKWTKEVRPDNGKHPILVWEKIKLFDEENQLFTVYTYGEEKWEEIYASVLVYDENGNDCLEENHPSKKNVIDYFAKGI